MRGVYEGDSEGRGAKGRRSYFSSSPENSCVSARTFSSSPENACVAEADRSPPHLAPYAYHAGLECGPCQGPSTSTLPKGHCPSGKAGLLRAGRRDPSQRESPVPAVRWPRMQCP